MEKDGNQNAQIILTQPAHQVIHQINNRQENVTYRLVAMDNGSSTGSPAAVKILHTDGEAVNIVQNDSDRGQPQAHSIIVQSRGHESNEPMYVVMAQNDNTPMERVGRNIVPVRTSSRHGLNALANAATSESHSINRSRPSHPTSSSIPAKRQHNSGDNNNSRMVGGDRSNLDELGRPRDEARRRQHNDVERRRRDKINTWIAKLAKIIPECGDDHTKQGQSKGGILAKAYQHIQDLQRENENLHKRMQTSNNSQKMGSSTPNDESLPRFSDRSELERLRDTVQKLRDELQHAEEDRDNIILQLKQQGVGLTAIPSSEVRSNHAQMQDGGVVVIGNSSFDS